MLNSLKKKNWIKSVKGANSTGKGKNIFILTNLELSESISGGIWYKDGVLNKEFIESLALKVESQMKQNGVMTEEQIVNLLRLSSTVDLEHRHVTSIITLLLFDDKIEKVRTIASSASTSSGNQANNANSNISSNQVNSHKYRLSNWEKSHDRITTIPALTKTPCGRCPLIDECKVGGTISPENCIYFNDW